MMNAKLIKKNVFWSIVLQITSIISGLIIPRILLITFGSETNGLVASINQFLNYVSLLEGGVSGVAVAALYRPIKECDTEKINNIVNLIRSYFLRLGLLCIGFTIAVAVVYPQFVETGRDKNYIFWLTIILGTRLIVQYCLSITYRLLIRANQRVYYNSIVQIIINVLHLVLLCIAVKITKDVLTVYCVSGIAYLIQPVFYIAYVKKHYDIHWTKKHDKNALAQKWDGFGQNLAYFIHTNTDIVLLTLFSTLTNISVYSVYLMIAGALKGLVSTISSAIAPSMGTILAQDNENESRNFFDKYEFTVVFIAFLLYTCGIQLVVPFVSVYTANVTDANYIQPLFGTLLLLAEMVYCIRDPYVNVAYASGHFKQTAKFAYQEALSNIVISFVLVQFWGLVGVAVGTLFAMTVRMIQQVVYLEKTILFRPRNHFFRNLIVNCSIAVLAVIISRFYIPESMNSYAQWLIYAVISGLTTITLFIAVNYKTNKTTTIDLMKKIIHV